MVVREQASNTLVNRDSVSEVMLLMKYAATKTVAEPLGSATLQMKSLSTKVAQLAKKAELAAMLSKNWAMEANKPARP